MIPSRDATATFNEEIVAEVLYRLQVTTSQQSSIGSQSYITPAFDPDDDLIGVLRLHWRLRL